MTGFIHALPDDEHLYVVHHPPAPPTTPSVVVLCPALFHEYPLSIRAYRVLTLRLVRAGHHVFRFDYRGTGDASGDGSNMTIPALTQDIRTVTNLAAQHVPNATMTVVGVTGGATLLGLASPQPCDRAVLWEPSTLGKTHVDALRRAHEDWLAWEVTERPSMRQANTVTEVLGYPFPSALQTGFNKVDLRTHSPPAPTILVGWAAPTDPDLELASRWRSAGAQVSEEPMEAVGALDAGMDFNDTTVPTQSINTIVQWIGKAP